MAFIGFLVSAGVLALRVTIERPCPTIDYDALEHRLLVESQAEGVNGWDILARATELRLDAEERAIEKIQGPDAAAHAAARRDVRSGEWYSGLMHNDDAPGSKPLDENMLERRRVAAVALEECRASGVVALVAEAVDAPRFVPTPTGRGERAAGASASDLLQVSLAEMRAAFVDGDEKRVLTSLGAVTAAYRAIATDPEFFGATRAQVYVPVIASEVRNQALHRGCSAQSGRAAIVLLRRIGSFRTLEAVFASIARAHRDLIQRCYTRDGKGSGRFVVSAFARSMGWGLDPTMLPIFARDTSNPFVDFAGLFMPSRTWAEREVARHADMLEQYARAPRHERSSVFDPDAYVAELPSTAKFLGVLSQNVALAANQEDVKRVHLNAAIVIVALRVYQAEHGEYPDSVGALVPGILASIPTDPFALDGAFRYKRTDGGFLLYSVASDGEDNGGIGPADPWMRAIERLEAGSDYVFSIEEPSTRIK